jgi:hypothetical protein
MSRRDVVEECFVRCLGEEVTDGEGENSFDSLGLRDVIVVVVVVSLGRIGFESCDLRGFTKMDGEDWVERSFGWVLGRGLCVDGFEMSLGEGIVLPGRCDLGEMGILEDGNSRGRFTAVSVVAFCFIVDDVFWILSRPGRGVTPFKLLGTTVVDEVIDTEESLDVILECIPLPPFDTAF